MKIKIFFKIFPYIIIGILLLMIFSNKKSRITSTIVTTTKDSIYTPIVIDSVVSTFDSILNPVPVITNDTTYVTNPVNLELVKKYQEAVDKLTLYKEAIKNNEYLEVFEDTLQQVTVKSNVQGKLLKQSVTTTLKKRTIPHYTTTVTNTIIKQDRAKVFLGIDIDIPTSTYGKLNYGVHVMYKTPNNNIWKGGIDNNGNIITSYSINLW